MAIHLEPVVEADSGFVAELVRDPATRRFTRAPEPPREGFAEEWTARYVAGRAEGVRDAFVVVDAAGGRLGIAIAPRIDREGRTVELGYVVAPEARGRGVATAALQALGTWAFDELGAERLELLISVENDASQRVAERCGYRLEGVLRQMYVKPGLREDTQLWSRLQTDPP